MKAFVFAFLATLASATQSVDAVADAEACQSGGLIQKRLDSQKAVLTNEADIGLNSSAKTKGTKKMRQKKKKLQALLSVTLLPTAASVCSAPTP